MLGVFIPDGLRRLRHQGAGHVVRYRDRLTDRQAGKGTARYRYRQTDRQTDRQAGRQERKRVTAMALKSKVRG